MSPPFSLPPAIWNPVNHVTVYYTSMKPSGDLPLSWPFNPDYLPISPSEHQHAVGQKHIEMGFWAHFPKPVFFNPLGREYFEKKNWSCQYEEGTVCIKISAQNRQQDNIAIISRSSNSSVMFWAVWNVAILPPSFIIHLNHSHRWV